MRRARIAIGTAALLLFSACYNAHGIRTSELPNLNGFMRGGPPAEVHDWSGHTVDFDQTSRLYLTRSNGDTVGDKFDQIAVQGGRFVGRTQNGKIINLMLPDIREASVDTYSRSQTIAGWIMAGVVVVGGILAFSLLSLQQSGSCPTASCAGLPTGGAPPLH